MFRWTIRRRRWPPSPPSKFRARSFSPAAAHRATAPSAALSVWLLLLAAAAAASHAAGVQHQQRAPNALDATAELVEGTALVARVAARNDPSTEPISGFATGKLNQFKGFYTPRPLPPNAQYTYSSIWASWSAWSFCAEHVQMRVRACNTVRGFSCLGANRETKPCGFHEYLPLQPLPPSTAAAAAPPAGAESSRDYDGHDPWAEDRREALRQLTAGDDAPPSIRPAPPPAARQRSAGRTFKGSSRGSYGSGVGPQAPPRRPPPGVDDGPPKAPSMTPELLFGSKLEIADQPINATVNAPATAATAAAAHAPADALRPFNSDAIVALTTSTVAAAANSSATVSTSPTVAAAAPDDERTVTVAAAIVPADFVAQADASAGGLLAGDADLRISAPGGAAADDANSLQLLANGANATSNAANAVTRQPEERTTMAEMRTAAANSHDDAAAATATAAKSALHSGEVVFPRDERITLETARAFEWMLANMSRAADAELLLKSAAHARRVALHSGEVAPRKGALNSGEFNPAPSLSTGAPRAHAFAEHGWRNGGGSGGDNEVRRKAASAVTQWAPVSADRAAALHIKSLADADALGANSKTTSGVSIRPSAPDATLSDVSIEKLERDLLKIQSVMRQIEGELQTLQVTPSAAAAEHWSRARQSGSVGGGHKKRAKGGTSREEERVGIDLVPTAEPRTSHVPAAAPNGAPAANEIVLVNVLASAKDAEWSEWRPWAECFCARQVRTRVCKYDEEAYGSRGCGAGRSYESRPCVSVLDACPKKTRRAGATAVTDDDDASAAAAARTTTVAPPEFYTLATRRAGTRHDGAAFRPRPLAIASLNG